MCPYGAAQVGSLVDDDLTPVLGLAAMAPGWEIRRLGARCQLRRPPRRLSRRPTSPGYARHRRAGAAVVASARRARRALAAVDIDMTPIGVVVGAATEATDDHWGPVEATIELDAELLGPDATAGLDEFSHLEVVFVFDRVADDDITVGRAIPGDEPTGPPSGSWRNGPRAAPTASVSPCASSSPSRATLRVRGLDAIDGTPVLDVKPYMSAFGPRGAVRQPAWVEELMRDYW